VTDRPGFLPEVLDDQTLLDWPGRKYLQLRDVEIWKCLSGQVLPEPLLILDRDELIWA